MTESVRLSAEGRSRFAVRDLLLVIGLCLAPMTGLRIWKVGPGEVLCLVWGLKYLFRGRLRKSDVLRFFVLFYVSMLIGTAIGYFVAPRELRMVDLLTWLYLGVIAVSLYEGLKTKTLDYIERLFYLFARAAALWNLFLYIYSRTISASLLGAPIWYHGVRFTGGATNPHQVAILLCGLTFLFIRETIMGRRRLINAVYTAVCVYLMIQTASSTGVLALAMGAAVTVYYSLVRLFPKRKSIVRVLMVLTILMVLAIGGTTFANMFIEWVEKKKNGLERFDIFSSISDTFTASPLFGLGPGEHSLGGLIEYHNTYLEILAATGLVGTLVFIVYTIRLFKKAFRADWRLLPMLISMYAYGLAGFAMRRLVYWGIIAFISVIAEQRIAQGSINAVNAERTTGRKRHG